MSESDKPFTVSDRRHFTPEGRARDEAASEPAAAAREETPAAGPAGGPGQTPAEKAPPASATGPIDFGQFLLSLGAQAGMLLSGQVKDEEPASALEAARHIVSILEMLEDKTRGRRTEEEERILSGLLFELRMAYVERSRANK